MKKLVLLAAMAAVLTCFNSCRKDQVVTKNELSGLVSPKYVSEYGKYQKELLIFDATKENSVFLVCHSENEDALNRYLNNTDLELIVDNSNQELKTKSGKISNSDSIQSFKEPQDFEKNIVNVDIITYNLKSPITKFYLSVNSKEIQQSYEQTCKLKSASSSYIPNWSYAVSYTSLHKAKFFGVSHYGTGWGEDLPDYYVRMYKTNCGLCPWDFLWDGWIYHNMPYWAVMNWTNIPDNQYPYTRLKIIVMPDSDDPHPSDQNYHIAYSPSEFYGQNCTIGSYDSRSCYVGTAPTGTTAFIWGNNFYYTPINGNQCPLSGSSFDSVNCYVMAIPSNCEAFINSNNWYVKPDLIDF